MENEKQKELSMNFSEQNAMSYAVASDDNNYTEISGMQNGKVRYFRGNNGKMKMVVDISDENVGLAETDGLFISETPDYIAGFCRTSNGKLMEMAKQGYKVSIELPMRACACKCERISANSLIYKNISENTDIEYKAEYGRVKEDIVVKEKREKYEYVFCLKTEGLDARLDTYGRTVSLSDAEDNEIFRIPAPHMSDANGQISFNVRYALDKINNGEFLLTVIADPEWINAADRALPVRIDPTIFPSGSSYITLKAFFIYNGMPVILPDDPFVGISGGTAYSAVGSVDYLGLLSANGIAPADVTQCKLSLESKNNVNSQYVVMSYPNNKFTKTDNVFYGTVYEVPLSDIYNATGSADFMISPTSSSTGTTQFFASRALTIEYTVPTVDSLSIATPPNKTLYKVGEPFDKSGMVVKAHYSSGTVSTITDYTVSKTSGLGLGDIDITLTYQGKTVKQEISVYEGASIFSEVERYQTYFEENAGNAGDFSVNLHTGRLSLVKPLITLAGNKLPLDLSLVYDSHRSGAVDPVSGLKGWKFNYEQYVYALSPVFIYVDASFRRHVFKPLGMLGGKNAFYDSNGTGLVMYEDSASSIRITNGRNGTMTFTKYGTYYCLTSVTETNDVLPLTMTLSYSDGKLTSVTDGMDQTVNIVRNASSTVITRPDGKTINLTLENAGISQIDDINGQTCVYSYNTQNGYKLLKQSGILYGEDVSFTYDGNPRVTQVLKSFLTLNGSLTTSKVLSNTDIAYEGYHSILKSYRYQQSEPYKTTIYNFTDDGKFVSSFEDKDGETKGVRFGTLNSYSRYISSIGDKESTLLTFNGVPTNVIEFSALDNFRMLDSETVTLTAHEGEMIVVSADASVENITSKGPNAGAGLSILGSVNQYARVDLGYGGLQALTLGFVAPATGTYTVSVAGFDYKGKVTFSNVRIGKCKIKGQNDVVNVNTGGAAVTELHPAGNKTWYGLCDCKINGATYATVVNGSDLSLTLDNYAKDPSAYVFWNNDLTKAFIGSNGTYITWENSAQKHYVSSLKYASVAYERAKKIFTYVSGYGSGSSFKTTVQNTVSNEVSKICTTVSDNYYKVRTNTDSRGVTETVFYDGFGIETSRIADDGSLSVKNESSYASGDSLFIERQKEYVCGIVSEQESAVTLASGLPAYDKDPSGETTGYAYKSSSDYIETISSSSKADKNSFTYKGALPETVGHNDFSFTFDYDDYGDVSTIKVGTETVLGKGYSRNSGENSQVNTYGNGQITNTKTDKYGRTIKKEFRDSTGVLYQILSESTFDEGESGKLTQKKDSSSGNDVYHIYTYDEFGNLEKVRRTDGLTVEYNYDPMNRCFAEKYSTPCHSYDNEYTYSDGDTAGSDTVKSCITLGQFFDNTVDTYDKFNRLDTRVSKFNGFANVGYEKSETYTYCHGETDQYTTAYPKSVNYKIKTPSGITRDVTDTYEYDSRGNITSVTRDGMTTSYQYDSLGRLHRENNQKLNKTFVFAYDDGGNILSRHELSYTIDEVDLSAAPTADYKYGHPWKDRLTKYNGYDILYDGAGNPTTYKGKTLEWTRGRLLKKYDNITYGYDADGLRTNMYVPGQSGSMTLNLNVEYKYESGKLISEKRTLYVNGAAVPPVKITYVYNHTGIIGFILTDETHTDAGYHYIKNLQGDILEIISDTGEKVAEYAYDAWGNCEIVSESDNIGNTNRIRYRGYYWDNETGLYYLKSRYYDPETGRFINADEFGYLDPQTINGLNLYAYCLNNPVMHSDPNGTFVWLIFWVALIAGAISGAVSGTVDAISEGEDWWKGALIGGLKGAVTGAAFGIGAGFGAAAMFGGSALTLGGGLLAFGAVTAGGSAAGMGIYAAEQGLYGREFNMGDMLKNGASMGIQSAMNFGIGFLMGKQGFYKPDSNRVIINKGLSTFVHSMGIKFSNKTFLTEFATRTYLKNIILWPIITIIKTLFQ